MHSTFGGGVSSLVAIVSNEMKITQSYTVEYGMVMAKRDILTKWKGVEVPSFNACLAEMTNLLQMERIRYDVFLLKLKYY